MTELAARLVRPIGRLPRPGAWVLVLAGVAVVAVAASAARTALHRGEAMPGVRILGADLGGTPARELGPRVRALAAERLARPIPLAVADERVRISANRVFVLDREATVRAVLAAGRDSAVERARSVLSPLTQPEEVAPVLVPRPAARARLDALLRRFVRPPVAAAVVMDGLEPVTRPARTGTRAALEKLLAGMARRVATGAGAVPVGFEAAAPPVDDAAAEVAAAEARAVVSAPVALSLDGRPLGTLQPLQLARLLRFHGRGGRLVVGLDGRRLARVLDPRVAPWKRRARNARFVVAGRRVRILPSQEGLGLDAASAAASIVAVARDRGDRAAELSLRPLPPADLTTAEARGLGIRERVSTFTTEMGPSSANRIHNVHLMANYIDGTIVRPGQRFSFNGIVGPRTPERGFLEGQMIVGSLLLPSIGGGVCQTATTLFNNAFELGLPILERHNHSFYISHYPLGRDATVSWGGPDFVFRNDMEHALLIKTSYTDSTLTFSFYGTDDGRRVTSRTGPQTNWREPEVTYALDPAAPPGSVRHVAGEHQSGFDVTVFRTVTKSGKVLRRDRFKSRYIPVGDTVVYGPGQDVPTPYFVIPET